MKRERRVWLAIALALGLGIGCGSGKDETESLTNVRAAAPIVPIPAASGPRDIAILEIAALGEIRIELLPELAPKSVESFISLAEAGLYDGTLFHRVIPGFMIQGGDPNSKDDDPSNGGKGSPGYRLPDEFSEVSFVRGIVALAHTEQKNSAGSQFFIVHEDSRQLDGQYTVIGRVIGGINVVDAISRVPTEPSSPGGPRDRPRSGVVLNHLRIEKGDSASAEAEPAKPSPPSREAPEWDEGST